MPDSQAVPRHSSVGDLSLSATTGEDALRLLAEASRIFHGSLEIEPTLRRVAAIAVPRLADFCIVDLVDVEGHDHARRAAGAHADPAKAPLVAALHAFPPDLANERSIVSQVLRDGRPRLVAEWREEHTRAKALSDEHARILTALAPRSGMFVPLRTPEGTTLGAMTFFLAESGRHYGPGDLELATALAERATVAIENARLHSTVSQARDALADQSLELELQSQQLQEQATQMEEQQAELEHQTEELLSANRRLEQLNDELAAATEDAERAERWVAGILAAIGDPFVVQDAEWRFRYINGAAAAVFDQAGRSPEALTGTVLWEAYPDLVGTRFEREMRRAMEERVPVVFEEFYQGTGRWAEMRCFPLAGGGIATLWRDVSERKRAEETLHFLSRGSEILGSSLDYEATVQAVAELVVPRLADWCTVELIGADGALRQIALAHVDPSKVAWARELAARYPTDGDAPTGAPQVVRTGKSELYPEIPEALLVAGARDAEHLRLLREVGFTAAIVVPLAARDRVLGALSLISAESGRRYTTDDLRLAEELARRAALAIDNARLHQESVAARDALESSREELEVMNEELRQTNDDLAEATRSAEQARQAAEEANLAKTEFLARMSHELRTPLNAIGGYVDLLDLGVRGEVSELQREDLARIRRAQHHLLGLINDVLNFAKLEAGRVEYQIERVPVHDVVEGLAPLVAPQLRARRQHYECAGAPADLAVRADAEKVRQVLLNLLSNAIKFTPEGGTVGVHVTSDAATVTIAVRDTGPGVPDDKHEAIFAPFVQLARGRTSTQEGTGLGLAISRDLARAMGGDIAVVAAPGGGSEFRLSLPRAVR